MVCGASVDELLVRSAVRRLLLAFDSGPILFPDRQTTPNGESPVVFAPALADLRGLEADDTVVEGRGTSETRACIRKSPKKGAQI